MDALKSAGRALIRSPSLAKQSWVGGRHRSECVRPGSGLRRALGQSGPAASSCPARPGPGGHVRLGLGRVGGERAELGVLRCDAARTPRASPLPPAQLTGLPLESESYRFPAPRGEPCLAATRGLRFLLSGRVQVARVASRLFSKPVSLVSSLGGCLNPWAPRQKADSHSLPLLPGV